MHIRSLSGSHRQTLCTVAFVPPKTWRKETLPTLILNFVVICLPLYFPHVVSVLFHALQRKKANSIPDFTSREGYFPLQAHRPRFLLSTGTAKEQNLWVLSIDIFFVGFSGSLDQATQVLQWREKITSVLELVEKF